MSIQIPMELSGPPSVSLCVILLLIPVVSEFKVGAFVLVCVDNEGVSELAGRVLVLPEDFHAQNPRVKIKALFQIFHAQHRVVEFEIRHRG